MDLDGREVTFADMAPMSYDYLVIALGAKVELLRRAGAAEHAFPLYTLADAVRLRTTSWSVGGRRPGPGARWRTARSTSSSSAAGPTGSRAPARSPSCTGSNFAKDYPDDATGQGPDRPRRGGRGCSCRCSGPTSAPIRSAS